MDFLDRTLGSAEENLALDEALLLEAEAGGPEVLRVWEWPEPAIILGSGCKLVEDVHVDACRADGVPILRRSSGGGTVVLGRGCLCYSLVLAFNREPALTEIRPSYAWILSRLIDALAVPGLAQAGISDLCVDGYKVSGNAQQRKRHHLLHHGTVLYDFDLELLGRYLHLPQRQPDYRGGREHAAFVRNLAVSRSHLLAALRRVWQAEREGTVWPAGQVSQLVQDKYATEAWTQRR